MSNVRQHGNFLWLATFFARPWAAKSRLRVALAAQSLRMRWFASFWRLAQCLPARTGARSWFATSLLLRPVAGGPGFQSVPATQPRAPCGTGCHTQPLAFKVTSRAAAQGTVPHRVPRTESGPFGTTGFSSLACCLTLPSSGRPPACRRVAFRSMIRFAAPIRQPPLMSNVRPHRNRCVFHSAAGAPDFSPKDICALGSGR